MRHSLSKMCIPLSVCYKRLDMTKTEEELFTITCRMEKIR